MPRTIIDLTGQTYGRLTALQHVASDRTEKSAIWSCSCSCGTVVMVPSSRLRSGKTRSCGCLRSDTAREHALTNQKLKAARLTRNGETKHFLFQTYASIVRRCQDPLHPSYRSHGATGIRCLWRSFSGFLATVEKLGPRPTPQHTIDRVTPTSNYGPGLVVWSDKSTQSYNRGPRRSASEVFISKLSPAGQAAHYERWAVTPAHYVAA